MGFSPEQLIRIIRWKLGIPVDKDYRNLPENWKVLSNSSMYKDFASNISKCIAYILEMGIRVRLSPTSVTDGSEEDISFFNSLWASVAQWVLVNETKRSPRVTRKIYRVLFKSLPVSSHGGGPSGLAVYSGTSTKSPLHSPGRPSKEELLKAIRWKLGIPVEKDNERSQTFWSRFAIDPSCTDIVYKVAQSIAEMLEEVIIYRLELLADHSDLLADLAANSEGMEHLDSLWECFVQWLHADEARRSPRVNGEITRAVTRKTPSADPTSSQQVSRVATEMYNAASKYASNLQDKFLSPKDERSSGQMASTISKHGAATITPLKSYQKAHELPGLSNAPDSSHQPRRIDVTSATKEIPDIRATMGEGRQGRGETSSIETETPAPIIPSAPQTVKTEAIPPVSAEWRYLPVPEGPDKHPEFDARAMDSIEGFKLIGARARGKKHKHDGTNCDDWFQFCSVGDWTIIAVSDGAGSKKFSRVGARAACETAVAQLALQLENHKINFRDSWTADTLRRDEATGIFAEADLDVVQKALHNSMQKAYEAVERATAERQNSLDHFQVLGRRVEVRDLSATLLLSVHTNVPIQNGVTSLVFSCSIGDGMIAVIDKNGVSRLLMTPDSGQFSGEVTFLTKKEVQPDRLLNRTFVFLGAIRALMLMTDGVADDYFPNDPGMSRLYGDMVLNQVITLGGILDSDIAAALQKTMLYGQNEVAKAEFHSIVETLTNKDPAKVRVRSTTSYSEKLDVPLSDVIASPALLIAGSQGEPMCDETLPEEKLRVWLDSYHIRGSFDDRTMVVLYREVLP